MSGLVTPLLEDKTFELSPMGETKIEDRPARGVRVVMKGQPDVSLFFAKDSGLLVKVDRRGQDLVPARVPDAQAVATLYLVDPALDVVLRSLAETQDELARRIGRVLEESRFYSDFAIGRLTDLTRHWTHGKGQVEPHIAPILTEMLCWFGPPGEEGVETLVAEGVLTLDNEGMRQAYLDEVAPTLLELGYEIPVSGKPGAWTLEKELPWELWNGLQRRLETTR